jgi:3-aminobutyryl-CoA ammonia-lyase
MGIFPQHFSTLICMAVVGDQVVHRVRLGQQDAHYGGGLVDGAHLLKLFGDVATELLIRSDGVEGLLRAYSTVDFLAPVYGGDFLEIKGEILQVGNTSRLMRFKAFKVIAASRDPVHPDQGQVLNPPLLVAQAEGTCVVKK